MADLQAIASQVRRDILRMVHAVSSGHPGGSLGCADLLTYLYNERLTLNASSFTMDALNEDLFFLSNAIFHQFGIVYWLDQDSFPLKN